MLTPYQKALNLFNAALVTPTYYVFFTSATIITSAILFQGFRGTAMQITTVIMGFLQICAGVVLLQLSKSAKDVPDAAVFKGDLDQLREVAEVEEPESEPKADAIRGGASIIRRFSQARQKMEHEEAKRLRQDTMKDHLEPLNENEVVEWDGLRRRKTIIGGQQPGTPIRRKTLHPPLGMSRFPNANEAEQVDESHFFEDLRTRASTLIRPRSGHAASDPTDQMHSPIHPVALTEINVHPNKPPDTPIMPYGPGSIEDAQAKIYGYQPAARNQTDRIPSPRSKPLPSSPHPQGSLPGASAAKRQFSFTSLFHRENRQSQTPELPQPTRPGLRSRQSSHPHEQKKAIKNATEEERLGLVKGDSHTALIPSERFPARYDSRIRTNHSPSSSGSSQSYTYDEDDYDDVEKNLSPHQPQDRSGHLSDKDDWQITTPPSQASPPTTSRVPLPSNPRPNVRSQSPPMPTNQPQPTSQTQHPPRQDRAPGIGLPDRPRPQRDDPSSQPQALLPTSIPLNSGQAHPPRPALTAAPAAVRESDRSQTSWTSRNLTSTTNTTRNEDDASRDDVYTFRTESGADLVRVESPEEYEARRDRFRAKQGGGGAQGSGGSGSAFV